MQSLNSLVRSKVASPARRCPTTQCYNVAQHWAEPIQWPSQLQHQQLPRYYRPPLQKKPSSGQLSTQLAATSESGVQAVAPTAAMMTCKRCKQRFSAEQNTKTSCSYHPALYSGGEVAKAIGFVLASDAPEDQLEKVVGRRGLMRFWDCCGDEDEGAAGCCTGFHITFDDEFNEARGWQ